MTHFGLTLIIRGSMVFSGAIFGWVGDRGKEGEEVVVAGWLQVLGGRTNDEAPALTHLGRRRKNLPEYRR